MTIDEILVRLGIKREEVTDEDAETLEKSLGELPEDDVDPALVELGEAIGQDPERLADFTKAMRKDDDGNDDEDDDEGESNEDQEEPGGESDGDDEDDTDAGDEDGKPKSGKKKSEDDEEDDTPDDAEVDALLEKYGITAQPDEQDGKPMKKSADVMLEAMEEEGVPLDVTTTAMLKGFGAILDEHLGSLRAEVSALKGIVGTAMEKSVALARGATEEEGATPRQLSPGAIMHKAMESPADGTEDTDSSAGATETDGDMLAKALMAGMIDTAAHYKLTRALADGSADDDVRSRIATLRTQVAERFLA